MILGGCYFIKILFHFFTWLSQPDYLNQRLAPAGWFPYKYKWLDLIKNGISGHRVPPPLPLHPPWFLSKFKSLALTGSRRILLGGSLIYCNKLIFGYFVCFAMLQTKYNSEFTFYSPNCQH